MGRTVLSSFTKNIRRRSVTASAYLRAVDLARWVGVCRAATPHATPAPTLPSLTSAGTSNGRDQGSLAADLVGGHGVRKLSPRRGAARGQRELNASHNVLSPRTKHSGEYNQVSHNANVVFLTDLQKPTHRKSPMDRTMRMVPSTAEVHCDTHDGTQVKITFARVRTTSAALVNAAATTSVAPRVGVNVAFPSTSGTVAALPHLPPNAQNTCRPLRKAKIAPSVMPTIGIPCTVQPRNFECVKSSGISANVMDSALSVMVAVTLAVVLPTRTGNRERTH